MQIDGEDGGRLPAHVAHGNWLALGFASAPQQNLPGAGLAILVRQG
jgi:hypothetical protein